MDESTKEIINLVLQLAILLVSLITSYHTTRKLMTQRSRHQRKKELVETVNFIVQQSVDSQGRLKSQDEMLRSLVGHFKLSSGNSE